MEKNSENKALIQKAGQLIWKIIAIGKKLPNGKNAKDATPEQEKQFTEQQNALEELKNTMALIKSSNAELKPFINNVDSSIKNPVIETITRNKKEFNKVKKPETIVSKILTLNSDIKKIHSNPFLQKHDFGQKVYTKQALPQLNKVLLKLDKNREEVSDSKQWLDNKASVINSGEDEKITAKPRNAMQEQLFDIKNESNTTTELYDAFFRTLALGSVFAPKHIETKTLENGAMVKRYSGFDGRQFTVLIGSNRLTKKVKANNLSLKPKGFRADTEYDKYYVKGIGLNSSHLIGDWFGGPGQARAYNVVAASDEYNHQVMGDVEKEIVKDFIEYNAFSMDMDVRIEWGELVSDKALELIIGAIANNMKGLEQHKGKSVDEIKKILRDFYNAHQKEAGLDKENLGMKRIMNVTYDVSFRIKENPTAKVEVSEKSYKTKKIDIWLGLNK